MLSLWNSTDQVFASPDAFETEKEAQAYAKAFRQRFAAQGYYLTADGYRISPDDVELVVVPVEE
jgi:hypothetical protein